MIPINLPSGNYLLIPVPGGANQFEMNGNYFMTFYPDGGSATFIGKSYEIVGKGLCSEITEEEWKGVIERYFPDEQEYLPTAFWDYPKYKDNGPLYDATSTESGHSLIQSHHQQPDRCVLVRKL